MESKNTVATMNERLVELTKDMTTRETAKSILRLLCYKAGITAEKMQQKKTLCEIDAIAFARELCERCELEITTDGVR